MSISSPRKRPRPKRRARNRATCRSPPRLAPAWMPCTEPPFGSADLPARQQHPPRSERNAEPPCRSGRLAHTGLKDGARGYLVLASGCFASAACLEETMKRHCRDFVTVPAAGVVLGVLLSVGQVAAADFAPGPEATTGASTSHRANYHVDYHADYLANGSED